MTELFSPQRAQQFSTTDKLRRAIAAERIQAEARRAREKADDDRREADCQAALEVQLAPARAAIRATPGGALKAEVMSVIAAIEARHGVPPGSVLRKCRKLDLVAARQEAVFQVATQFDVSVSHLARLFRRDRATIHHAVKAHQRRVRNSEATR